MMKHVIKANILFVLFWLAGCGRTTVPEEAVVEQPIPPSEATAVPEPTDTPTTNLPEITAVSLDRSELPNYESLEIIVKLEADYSNPYDAREISLDGVFTGPDGTEMNVPGFWDGKESWRIRFTPSQEGEWQYQITVKDMNGESEPVSGAITSIASDLHGWILPGNAVNPDYSGHYLVYHDGTPFYGLGHADALNILIDGFNIDRGVGLFNNMVEAGENYVVYWPLYSHSPLQNSYDEYIPANMDLIDVVVKDAQEKGVFLIFTIWDHPQLRDETHDWGDGRWNTNGFNKYGDIASFFTDEEVWAWQENFYRYNIARWGYSPAIGMWQTVSEINGTNAYDQTDPWHEKVNAYFVENDSYRHPTTASRSGDVDWEAGHLAMDAPQVHIYDFDNDAGEIDAVAAADVLAYWTSLMRDRAEKPNWVGEFGVAGNSYYPELFHNSIWAALATGAAMTPAEWNSGGSWMRMSDEMLADMSRLGEFVADMPLAALNPSALQIESSDAEVRGWGMVGEDGGFIWLQDYALRGRHMDVIRADETVRQDVEIIVEGLAAGMHKIQSYDTWQGSYLDEFSIECTGDQACMFTVPDFHADIALKIEREN
jgi:hypothetical protein